MNCIEHYFENLLTIGSDIKGEPNKNALSKEVQEAIDICAYYIKHNQFQEQTTKNDIRLNRVKNELNQVKNELEPTTKNDLGVDCISRTDAIKAMQDKAKELKNEDTINGLCGAVAILFDLPTVTPQEPRKGKWTKDCQCTNCGERPYGYYGNVVYIKYCPNCGAKMESEGI